jgi:hypothetical protein
MKDLKDGTRYIFFLVLSLKISMIKYERIHICIKRILICEILDS